MKLKYIFRKFTRQTLFKLSLIVSFILTAGFDLSPQQADSLILNPASMVEPSSLETLELILGLYFSIGLSMLFFQRISKTNKKDRPLIYLIFFLVLAICYVCLAYRIFPEIFNDFFFLSLSTAFFSITLPFLRLVLRIIFDLIQKFRRLFTLKQFLKVASGLILIIVVILFGRHYYFLQKRVIRLEEIAGPKKLICNEKEVVKEIKKSVVRIIGIWGEGTGFFVDESGLIATNHHVVAYDPNPKIVLPDYSMVQGEVVMADPDADVAFIKINSDQAWPALSLNRVSEIEPMEELISIGYPLGTNLKGEATVIKGRFVAIRKDREMGVRLVQTDISLNAGASGGPMIDLCGEVLAVNTAGLAGLGMGVTAYDFQFKWWELEDDEEPLRDVEKISFNPDGSSKECVEAFYNYQTVGKLKEAYDLLSKNYTDWSFEKWQEGYKNTLNIIVYTVEEDDGEENSVFVKFSSADLVDEDIIYRYFEGTIEVVEVDGHLKLKDSNIKEIQEPDWEWFYSED